LNRGIESTYINLNPIQRGGVLTAEARKAALEFADGYSVCDFCFESRVDLVQNPPVRNLTADIAEFLNMDDVRFTAGCRHAKWAAMHMVTEPGETLVLDSLAHYTSYLAYIRYSMDATTINRTKSAIDALIEVQQLWIDNVPEYDLSDRELLILKKRLTRAIDNVQKIYDDNEELMNNAEESLKKENPR